MAKLCPAYVGYCGLVKMSDEQLTPAEGTKAAPTQGLATDSSRQLLHQKSNADAALDLLHSSQAIPQLDLVDAPKGISYAHNSATNEPRPVTAALVTVDDHLDQLELKLRSLRCASTHVVHQPCILGCEKRGDCACKQHVADKTCLCLPCSIAPNAHR